MRLEFLLDGSPDCPLIRLFDFTAAEAQRLAEVVADLAAGRAQYIAVHELPGLVPKGGCELVFRAQGWDQSVMQVSRLAFECGFTVGTWDNLAGLIEPFAAGSNGYQWLAAVPGQVSLLLSVSGQW